MNRDAAKIVLTTCMAVKKSESLLVVTDDKLYPLAAKFFEEAKALGYDPVLTVMKPRNMNGEEPPAPVAKAMQEADVSVLFTFRSLSHTRARKDACRKYGRRIASLPGVTEKIFDRSIEIDYKKMAAGIDRLSDIWKKGRTMRVTTKAGTDITMSIKGRKGFRDTGLYGHKGAFGNLPAGELAVAPIEGTTNGVVVIDASAPYIGKLKKPFTLEIKNGYVTHMPVNVIRDNIKSIGKNAYNFAELGIGTNPKAKITGNILEDEKVLDTAHMAIGNNESFGGKVYCQCHLDFVFKEPVVEIDGKRIE